MKIIRLTDSKLKSSWITSYICVLIIPFLLLIINYSIFSNSLKNNIISSNNLILSSIKSQSDIIVKEMDSFNSQIIQNPYLQSITNARSINADTLLGITELQQQLMNYKTLKFPIDMYFIYICNFDMILTSDSTFNGEDFFNFLNIRDDMTYDQWKDGLYDISQTPYDVYTAKINNHEKDMIFYKRQVTHGGSENIRAILVSAVDAANYFPPISDIREEKGTVCIVQEDSPILIFPKSSDLDLSLTVKTESGVIDSNIGDKKFMVSSVNSDIRSRRYIYAVPYRTFWVETFNVMIMSGIELLLMIILSVVVINLFVRKNYAPIKAILDITKKLPNISPDNASSELFYIKNTLLKLSELNKEFSLKLYKQDQLLINNFISDLLTHKITDTKEFNEYTQKYNIDFSYDHYAVALAGINDVCNLFPESDNVDEKERLSLASVIISNIMQEVLAENHYTLFNMIGDTIAFIISTPGNGQSDIDALYEHIEKAMSSVTENFDIKFCVSIGNIYDNPLELFNSYNQATQALEYHFLLPDTPILRHDCIAPLLSNNYKYDTSATQQLKNSIKVGNYQGAYDVINQVFADNFYNNDDKIISIHAARCLLIEMIYSIADSDLQADSGEKSPEKFYDIFNTCSDITEVKFHILSSVKTICEKTDAFNAKNSLKLKAERYVYENYADPNLSIAGIADALDVNAKYLSSSYKKQSESSLQNLINQVRTDHAINLLMTTDKSIKAVGEDVGYVSIRTFSRVFKNITGITPSQFRERKE